MRRLLAAAALLSLLFAAANLQAQSSLSVEVENSSSISRTGGPVSLALQFDWRGSGVLDGQLLLEVRDSENQLIGSFVLDDLYLTEGVTRQQIMLPAMNTYSMNNELILHMWLVNRDGRDRRRLQPAILRIPGQGTRSVVIAVCRPEYAGRRSESDVIDALRLDALFPEYSARERKTIATRTAELSPDDAPADPLRLCTFDMVLLTDDALAQLSEPQMAALLAWTRAGGATCLVADNQALGEPQLEFINGLLDSDDRNPEFLLDSAGQLVFGAGEEVSGPLTSRCGLGRSVIVGLDGESTHASAEHWPSTSAFLWRLRQEHLASVASEGVWNLDTTVETARQFAENQYQSPYGYNWQVDLSDQANTDEMLRMQASNMDPVPIRGGTGLLTRLMPGDIRIVPLWLIGMVLTCYIGVIGPLDYFVLGRLGLRRFTWVSFPAVTLVFTLCSVVLSNSFLNVAAERKSIAIRDLDDTGVVTRENRLEMLFPSRSRTMETELGRGLFCALRHQDFSQMGYWYGPYGYQMWEQERADAAQFIGRMPARTTVVQRIGQWTPQLNRSFTIPVSDDPAQFTPLADPRLKDFIRNRSHGAILQHLRSSTENLVGVYLYAQDDAHSLHGPQRLFQSDYEQWNQVYVGGVWESRMIDFLQELSVRRQPGFFAVVSQVSPTGGYRFEDMALLDQTDHRQSLLVVAIEEDNQLVLYRKLYVIDD